MTTYGAGYSWNPDKRMMDWGIHNGHDFIRRGFKTRKQALAYIAEHFQAVPPAPPPTYIITTHCPTFGRGYFLGFDKEGRAHFQSCYDHRVLTYKVRHNAEKRIARILQTCGSLQEGETFSVESIAN